jgi:hypothetical protein
LQGRTIRCHQQKHNKRQNREMKNFEKEKNLFACILPARKYHFKNISLFS